VIAGKTIKLGRVTGIELNHKPLKIAKKGSPAVAVKIEGPDQPLMGRQVPDDAQVVSLIDRESIDVLRKLFRDEVTKEEWVLIARFFKKLFDIPDPNKSSEAPKPVDSKAL
jgi:translation initiation factor 5B